MCGFEVDGPVSRQSRAGGFTPGQTPAPSDGKRPVAIPDRIVGAILAGRLALKTGLLHCLSGPLPKPSIDQQNLQIPEATSDKSRATTSSWGIGQ